MNFRPNVDGKLYPLRSYNMDGEPVFAPARAVRVAILELLASNTKTTVRTDSSATKGDAAELVLKSRILFPPDAKPSRGARFDILGYRLLIDAVQPRIAVDGRLDHYEATLSRWDTREDAV